MKHVEFGNLLVAEIPVSHNVSQQLNTKPYKKPGAARHPVRDLGLVHGLPAIDDDGLTGQIGTHV